ncbi:putative beta-galactosidase [Lineolata rhizophorae]|uniref:Beta-galactosidase n=1 Tax=Lineolata rhizophorae TaxID=578093 RepID=A0A6A6PBH4_9PEZI|nr:putative beta-galactosidase [Lineolata rhizophorae]
MFVAVFQLFVCLLLALHALGLAIGGQPRQWIRTYDEDPLQDIVTWDEHSLFIRGERVMLFSGEFHPFRLPVPDLWLDVFQKIRAMGYNCMSFYVDWALHEGKPGNFTAEGVFAWEPFFDAASQAGIYLIARPGPYINAEVSGGGFPGWLQRIHGMLRTADQSYLDATENYVREISSIIADAQITNGGPVILFQPENEYTSAIDNLEDFPDPDYFGYVEQQFRDAGIIIPFINNDASPQGYFAPGTGPAAVDIYGHDGYPLGFDCANPSVWPDGALPTNWAELHQEQSPSTPYSILEFQGGSFDPWGGPGFSKCLSLVNSEFERVFYKNLYSFDVTIFNIYMTYGGTNWGNLGHPGGYTSYDYGAVITEERYVSREKYSEAKLQANFIMSSPAYLTAETGDNSTSFTDTDALLVTPLYSAETKFFVIRHTVYNSVESTDYQLSLPTSSGTITIPQLSGSLTLNGRDSKIHLADYNVGDYSLLYSSAEVFTWCVQKYADKAVLVVYGGPGERHELAFTSTPDVVLTEGEDLAMMQQNGSTILNWVTSSLRRVVNVGGSLFVYILDRNSAYDYWVVNSPSTGDTKLIMRAGYLIRTAEIDGTTLSLTGDLNTTAPLEIISGAPADLGSLKFNGESLPFTQDSFGVVSATLTYHEPTLSITEQDLSEFSWHAIDTLPELQPSYDDSMWTAADLPSTNNTVRALTTPMSLYADDYGYHSGSLIYRGHFTANGDESSLYLSTSGGLAFGMAVWLGPSFLGAAPGKGTDDTANTTLTLPDLEAETNYVLTVIIDHMGLDEDWTVGTDTMKNPRGILDYDLAGHDKADVTWKLTGNLGGEDYYDSSRGPLNEGAFWVERQGLILPGSPADTGDFTAFEGGEWTESVGPASDIVGPGAQFHATSFELDVPEGYDVTYSFVFSNVTVQEGESRAAALRCQIFVNGFQFGKYLNNIGPQTRFPVPPGTLNLHGTNYVGMTVWSLEPGPVMIDPIKMVAGPPIQTGFGPVGMAPMSSWEKRTGAY